MTLNSGNINSQNRELLSSLSTEALLGLYEGSKEKISDLNVNYGIEDVKTEKLAEDIILELTSRKRIEELSKKIKDLTNSILSLNDNLEDLEDKNDSNWSVGGDMAITDMKVKIEEVMKDKRKIVEILKKLGYDENGEKIGIPGVVEKTKNKSEQLLLDL